MNNDCLFHFSLFSLFYSDNLYLKILSNMDLKEHIFKMKNYNVGLKDYFVQHATSVDEDTDDEES